MSGYIYLLKLTQNQRHMRKNKKKQSVVNSENVMTAVHVACACAAVASVLVPAAPVLGGIGLVCTKTIPSLLRGRIFF